MYSFSKHITVKHIPGVYECVPPFLIFIAYWILGIVRNFFDM